MGFADAVVTRLFLNRRQSDIEFKMQAIMQRKLAIMDECNKISEQLANAVFEGDNNAYISPASPLPGQTPANPLIGLPAPVAVPGNVLNNNGNDYELLLAELQGIEKELDTRQKKLETELEAVKAESESIKKIADDHAKKDFKIGG